ncbi:hypothetical protein IGB42_00152 [Andreprevotia sp. IGB-42]|uniref:GNAT family N-acetyltransferase n=1 Tax=Andreprevotia sp. IGB-42 TaxID=2497473 RepID=UPI00135AB646|nr:GNAT family N-acetyltransferase [Andreprevotia sp. IGB-42]KAF0815075.1 hypothetical protein IGB42_00152 [Andreprevotia sp. IGB-42]
MPGSIQIAFYTPDQLETTVDLLHDMSVHYNGSNASGRVAISNNLQQAILGPQSGVQLLIAAEEGKALALATLSLLYPAPKERGQLFMKELYVHSAHRSTGLGQLLMQWVARYAVAQNCLRFDWTVDTSNPGAIAFYHSLGATQVTDKLYFRLGGEDLLNFSSSS